MHVIFAFTPTHVGNRAAVPAPVFVYDGFDAARIDRCTHVSVPVTIDAEWGVTLDAGTYGTRFGDVCCESCHMPLAWSRAWVRDGLYGEGTRAWATASEKALLAQLA